MQTVSPKTTRVGWVGSGVMGSAMCGHVLAAGYAVTVHSRTPAKAAGLLDRGARWVDSVADVAACSDVVFTMVGYPQDVRDVYLSSAGLAEHVRPQTIVVDMTTAEPSMAVQIDEALRRRQASGLDAPVSGGDVGAREGRLSIMVGGDGQALDTVMPLLQTFGRHIVHQGQAGAGQHAKMCNQVVIASTMVGVCEALLYGHQAGLDLTTMLQSISGGAAGCWTLDNLAPRVLQGNFDPGFFVEHFIKDMGIALQEARRMGLALPGLALAHQLYVAVQAQGHGKCGTHVLIKALEQLSDVRLAS